MNGVAIVSGGLDSVTMAYALRAAMSDDDHLTLVSFDYGQRHARELQCAGLAADRLEARHVLIDIGTLGEVLPSALTDPGIEVPHGHYAADNMKATVVPNRNAIMLSIATGIAVAEHASFVATAVHAGDHAIYPDCRPEFIAAMTHAMRIANDGFIDTTFQIMAPFVHLSKTDIAAKAAELHVPIEDTWSCYEGGDIHCGACGTCVERREAMRDAGIDDPTPYAATPAFDAP